MNTTSDQQQPEEHKNLEPLERIDGAYILKEIGGVLNFEKGILYTIKELFLRPGKAVLEFILYDTLKSYKQDINYKAVRFI